jgi:hypothetical protein
MPTPPPQQLSDAAKAALMAGASLVTGLVVGVLLDPLKAYFRRRRVRTILYSELASVSGTLHMCEIEGSMSLEVASFADQSREAFLTRIERMHTKRFQHVWATDKDTFYAIDGADEIEEILSKVTHFISERDAMPYEDQVREVWALSSLFRHYQDLGRINRKDIERKQKALQKEGLTAIDNLCRSFAEHGKDSLKLRRFKRKHPELFKTQSIS